MGPGFWPAGSDILTYPYSDLAFGSAFTMQDVGCDSIYPQPHTRILFMCIYTLPFIPKGAHKKALLDQTKGPIESSILLSQWPIRYLCKTYKQDRSTTVLVPLVIPSTWHSEAWWRWYWKWHTAIMTSSYCLPYCPCICLNYSCYALRWWIA